MNKQDENLKRAEAYVELENRKRKLREKDFSGLFDDGDKGIDAAREFCKAMQENVEIKQEEARLKKRK